MPRLADQDAKPYHPEVLSLALGVSTPGQLARRLRVDVRIEVRRVEREHVRGKLEPGNGSFRDHYLRLLQLMLGNLLRDAMKGLPAERGSRQTRQARQTRIQKFPQLALGSGRARPLNRHCHSQLAHRWAALRAPAHARSMCATRSSCSATQINAPTSPTPRVPTVCVARRSAKGGGSAGPRTTWRATERPRSASHTD